MLERANGWQRLWVVMTILLFVWAHLTAIFRQESAGEEDPAKWLLLYEDGGTPYSVPGVGSVTFPSNLAPFQVQNYIDDGLATKPESVTSKARELMAAAREQANQDSRRMAESAKAENVRKLEQNKVLWIVSLAMAAIASAMLYLAGWAIAWIRRGFRSSAK